jgi:hypothetical protein
MGKYRRSWRKVNHVIYIDYDQAHDTSTIVKRPQDANMIEVDFFRAILAISSCHATFFNSKIMSC